MFGFLKRKKKPKDKAGEAKAGSAGPGVQPQPEARTEGPPKEFAHLLTSQLAAMWLDSGADKYRAEYLRRMGMCSLSEKTAEEMLAFEADILRQRPRPELLDESFISAPLFSLAAPFLRESMEFYETNLVFPFSYVVKLSDEAEWHYWNSHEKNLQDSVWAEIFALSDRNRKLFLPFARHLVEHMGWTVQNVNEFSRNEQGMLDICRWGKTTSAASRTPWGFSPPSPAKKDAGERPVAAAPEKKPEAAGAAAPVRPKPQPVSRPAPAKKVWPEEPLDDVSLIQEMHHETAGAWQQYDFLLAIRGYGWGSMTDWAQHMADGDLNPLQTLTCTLTLHGGEEEFIDEYRESGGKIAEVPGILEEEWSSLAVGGRSRVLSALVKIVWFNQTRVLRIFSTVKDETLMMRYAETLLRRSFGTEDAMKLAKMPEAAGSPAEEQQHTEGR